MIWNAGTNIYYCSFSVIFCCFSWLAYCLKSVLYDMEYISLICERNLTFPGSSVGSVTALDWDFDLCWWLCFVYFRAISTTPTGPLLVKFCGMSKASEISYIFNNELMMSCKWVAVLFTAICDISIESDNLVLIIANAMGRCQTGCLFAVEYRKEAF